MTDPAAMRSADLLTPEVRRALLLVVVLAALGVGLTVALGALGLTIFGLVGTALVFGVMMTMTIGA